MPENATEYLWWAMNGLILIVLFYARNDLKDIKDELREGRKTRDNHEIRITRLEVRCNLQHGDEEGHPMRRAVDFAHCQGEPS